MEKEFEYLWSESGIDYEVSLNKGGKRYLSNAPYQEVLRELAEVVVSEKAHSLALIRLTDAVEYYLGEVEYYAEESLGEAVKLLRQESNDANKTLRGDKDPWPIFQADRKEQALERVSRFECLKDILRYWHASARQEERVELKKFLAELFDHGEAPALPNDSVAPTAG